MIDILDNVPDKPQESRRFRSAWVDEAVLTQYPYWTKGLLRREHMELLETEADLNFNARVLREFVINKLGIFLEVGTGYGLDVMTLDDPNDIDYQGTIVGMEPRLPEDIENLIPFEQKFDAILSRLQSYGKDNFRFKEGYAQSISLGSNSVDYVLEANVLHEVRPSMQSTALDEIHRVLKPGGTGIVIENAVGNKRDFHAKMAGMGIRLGATYPGPRSAQFNFEKACEEIERHGFIVVATRRVDGRIKITYDNVPVVLDVADTYRDLLIPAASDAQWLEARLLEIEEPIMRAIAASPDQSYYDDLHRGAVIFRKPL